MSSRATKVPAITTPTDVNLRDVARQIKSILDVREGVAGDPLDRMVTFRDLVDGGLATTVGSGQNLSLTTLGDGAGSATPDETFETYDPTTDATIPPAPAGLTAVGLFAAVQLSWVAPAIRNYAYTEIWRSSTNTLGSAVRVGTSNGTSFVDYIGTGGTRYYWVRFVTQANITGPYNSTNGTAATTAQDPEYLLDVLTGEITESQLFADLGARINLIDGPGTGLVTQVSQLNGQYTVKIDNNGHVSGFGLASTTVNGTPTSAFIVRADRFAIAGANDTSDPPGTLNPSRLPFVVTNTATTINGVTVPAGTYINTAFIGNATIKKAQIGSVYADTIQAGYTSSVDLESSVFYGSEFYLGGSVTYEFNDPTRPTQRTGIASVSSPNIALTTTGAEFDVNYFKIKNGTLLYTPFEVSGGIVRIKNAFINNVQSDNYAAGSAGWKIGSNGFAEFGAASIRGQLTASQIDTRNLTIRDASGNILFGAGTNLNVASITGLGSLATQSSVSASDVSGLGALATRNDVLIGAHVKVWNGSFFQTVNVTDFVNTLSKINSSNISSFMESAAIGNAYIGNAAVGTLNIQGSSVTSMSYAAGGYLTIPAGGSVGAVAVGLNMASGSSGVVVVVTAGMSGNESPGATNAMVVYRNGSQIGGQAVSVNFGFVGTFTMSFFDPSPSPGYNVYQMNIGNGTGGDPGAFKSSTVWWSSITVTGGKR